MSTSDILIIPLAGNTQVKGRCSEYLEHTNRFASIAGLYRLITPYRLLLLPGNRLLLEDLPSPLHHLFSFRFAISEYEGRRLVRSHLSLLLAVHPFWVCHSLDRAQLLPLQLLD